jgi:hypothetical protein
MYPRPSLEGREFIFADRVCFVGGNISQLKEAPAGVNAPFTFKRMTNKNFSL